jgi:hypothetical protein
MSGYLSKSAFADNFEQIEVVNSELLINFFLLSCFSAALISKYSRKEP